MKEGAHPAMCSLYSGVLGLRCGVPHSASAILMRIPARKSLAFIDIWFIFDLNLPTSGLAQHQDSGGGMVNCFSSMIRLPIAELER